MSALREDHARRAYDALAPGYDALTHDHDHVAWTVLLEARARRAGLQGTRLLDVACGTGNTIVPMLERGYQVTGLDISEAMLAEARRKTGGRARLVAGDMRAMPVLGEFDLVWCLGDSMNYLGGESELVATLRGCRENLAAGGIVVFDVNTMATFRRISLGLLVVPGQDRVVVLEGDADTSSLDRGLLVTHIDRLEREASGWWRRARSEHRQRHHPEGAVRAACSEAGLSCDDVVGIDSSGEAAMPPDDSAHVKVVYIARREAP
jgi:SAM-dependent methyltransferase